MLGFLLHFILQVAYFQFSQILVWNFAFYKFLMLHYISYLQAFYNISLSLSEIYFKNIFSLGW